MVSRKRVIVTGATGLIGKAVCTALSARDYEVVVFSRDPDAAREQVPGAAEYVAWTPSESGPWVAKLDGAWGVISLAGASIAGKRWDEDYKRELRESRIIGTRGLVRAMTLAKDRPLVFVSGSAIGYYGARDDTPLDEGASVGYDFLARLVKDWEAEAMQADALGVRTTVVRAGVVLDRDEGALPRLMLPVQLFVGGPILPGTQWFSWVHLADEVGIILLALEDERARGALNATGPAPQTNRDFYKTLGKVLRRPIWAPVPGFALKVIVGEFADTLVTGQRVIPKKALELGYEFQYPTSEAALRAVLKP